MSLSGSCHCGSVRLTVPAAPEWVGSCNCSICRRTGWIGAYYPDDSVRVEGETRAYVWGDRCIGIHHCPVCACTTHWKTLGEDFGRMGVNARLLDGFEMGPLPAEVRVAGAAVELRLIDNSGN
ncbi:MAG: hypothetical protein QOG72_1233 [Sphingomonadales bacterium]|jgi:hypothetical protein|nr:hypothetical protein [Sphingomonadales bacterium]